MIFGVLRNIFSIALAQRARSNNNLHVIDKDIERKRVKVVEIHLLLHHKCNLQSLARLLKKTTIKRKLSLCKSKSKRRANGLQASYTTTTTTIAIAFVQYTTTIKSKNTFLSRSFITSQSFPPPQFAWQAYGDKRAAAAGQA